MKYSLLFCLGLAVALFSCQKDDLGVRSDSGSDDLSLSTSDESFAGIGSSSGSSGQAGDTTIVAGQLTAGEWNDLDNWDFWSSLIQKDTISEYPTHWRFNQFDRYSLLVKEADGQPVIDAAATLLGINGETLGQARTDNFGRAEFFPSLMQPAASQPASIKVDFQGQSFLLNSPHSYESGPNEMVVSLNSSYSQDADVFFVFDATGSMADELEYIKVEINDIISRIQGDNSNINFRLGSVFYRDEGDEYITRTSHLSSTFAQVVDFINTQRADGGGDFPEAVHSALQKSIEEQEWREQARARLLFLILDAPPHHEDNVIQMVQEQTLLAAQKGIKLIPVTASGINKETEFLMRIMAIATNAPYTFITNHSGIGNDHIEPTIGDYEVEFLNDLIVRLINKYVE